MTDTTSPTVLREDRGAIRILTLNRPEKLNAANLEMQQSLLAHLEDASRDPDLRAMVLTGAGRAFSAGGDREILKAMADGSNDQAGALADVHVGTLRTMLGLGIPIVAAVQGPAVGYAAGLVAMCDFVVMGEHGFLCDPHVTFGIGATTAAQVVWPRRTSEAHARDILMTGRKVVAEEAVQLGLANMLCAAGEELTAALQIAGRFAEMPATGVAATKREFNRPILAAVEELFAANGA